MFLFEGSPLQFVDAHQFATKADVTLSGVRFVCAENKMNPRQLDFSTPRFANWKLVQVKVGAMSAYAHAYPSDQGFLLNCFRGQPLGIATSCGQHLLWWIDGKKVLSVERTVKKKMMSSNTKVTTVTLEVQTSAAGAPIPAVPVVFDAVDDNDDAMLADKATAMAARARGIAVPSWPDGMGIQRIAFS